MVPPIQLPFAVQPQAHKVAVGDVHAGILEIDSCGGLLVQEQVYIDACINDLPTPFTDASRLAVKISEQEKIDLLVAFAIVAGEFSDIDQAAYQKCRIKYAEEIQSLSLVTERVSVTRKIATVTAVIRSRLNGKWTEEDTKQKLSVRLFEYIWNFAQDEITGGSKGQNLAPSVDDVVKPLGG